MTTPEASALGLQQKLKNNPRDVDALLEMGQLVHRKGDFEGGVRYLQRALEAAPQDPRGHLYLALAFRKEVQLDAALRHARAARHVAPSNLAVISLLGLLLRVTGHAEEAVALLEPVCRKDVKMARLYRELGLAQQQLGRLDAALESVQMACAREPDNKWFRCSEANVLAEQQARTRLTGRTDARRVALHLNKPFHYAILRPIFDALCERHHCLLTENPSDLERFDPDVVIVSDSQARALRSFTPRAAFVYTRHGLISKNHAFPAARNCDYICVSSEEVGEQAVARGGFSPEEVWVTGFVLMDPLFTGEAQALPFVLPGDRKTVLYAPTYNPKLSSAPMLGERLVALLRHGAPDASLIIKPHPLSFRKSPDWIAWWRRMAASDRNVHLITDEGADIVPYLQAADLLISDACSVAYAYLATDRPIVLLTNPEHKSDPYYDPEGIEWRWRDIGEEVFDVEDLPAAVARAFDEPARFAEPRAHYRHRLFGDLTDGRAAERIAERVTALPL